MRVFLSWSGERSRRVAEALRDWLPSVVQAIEPWLSSTDIPLGARWAAEVGDALKQTDAGVICLTDDNMQAGWLNFEAGAISNISERTLVCVYSLDRGPSDISGPLSLFQCARADFNGTKKLANSLNHVGQHLTADQLARSFDRWWPDLEIRLAEIATISSMLALPTSSTDAKLNEIFHLLHELPEKLTVKSGHDAAERLHDARPPTERPLRPRRAQQKQPTVFIASSLEGLVIAQAIRKNLAEDLKVTLWNQPGVFHPELFAIESLVDIAAAQDFAVIVLTPDDVIRTRESKELSARDNLLFQLGLFTGSLGRARTFLVHQAGAQIRLPTDLFGVTIATYSRRKDENLAGAVAPVCMRLRRAIGAA